MQTTMKSCLFGGALLSAGLAANEAGAQSWTHDDSSYFQNTYAVVFIEDYILGGHINYNVSNNSDPTWSSSATVTNGTTGMVGWDAPGGAWDLSLSTASTYPSFIHCEILSAFTVSEDSLIEIAWDFADFSIGDSVNWGLADVTNDVFQGIDGVSLLSPQDNPSESVGPVGSVLIPLDSSRVYALFMNIDTLDPDESGSIHARLLPVPSPTAAPLFAIAGLIASRRKRPA